MLFILHMLAVVGVVMLVGVYTCGVDDEIGDEEDND